MNKAIRITAVLLVSIAFANLCSHEVKAQSIAGTWYGISDITRAPGFHLSSTEEKGDILQLSRTDPNKLSGVGYHYYWFRGKFYYYIKDLEGNYDTSAKEWVIKETSVRDNHLFYAHYSCLRTYRMQFIKRNQKDSLTGEWAAASFDDCGAGWGSFGRTKPVSKTRGHADSIEAMLRVALVRGNAPARSGALQASEKVPQAEKAPLQVQRGFPEFKKDSVQMLNKGNVKQEEALQQLLSRGRKQIQEISLKTPDVKVEIWDNNVIDGDNISLYFNKELIVNRKRLNATPITVNIRAIPGKDNELVMYANNLGEIPPNTAMMRIYADGKEYEVYMSSDEQSSSMVKFIF